ncbi:nacht and wd domain protein [Ophiostoma piceae UAMH 11346]|uniref:Nacht and wd domain protein n=1 Tax=Ophiostoma piceae (strain UAMH 11346) TaxID=1262450 RepID=S3BY87_OPHP1|nr:nacht and wd domain protein [Ophiostoma piceae UAMH 11346]
MSKARCSPSLIWLLFYETHTKFWGMEHQQTLHTRMCWSIEEESIKSTILQWRKQADLEKGLPETDSAAIMQSLAWLSRRLARANTRRRQLSKDKAGLPPIEASLKGEVSAVRLPISSGETYLCPFCGDELERGMRFDDEAFRRHVLRHIRPYVCTFEACKDADCMYATQKEWEYHEMQEHRRAFFCHESACSDVFWDQQEMRLHLTTAHRLGTTSGLELDLTSGFPYGGACTSHSALEPGFTNARILTFGYDADTNQTWDYTFAFHAESLLGELEAFSGIGKVPIIFVAHSLGGLVVEFAFKLGSENIHLKSILEKVHSIVFLATPHSRRKLSEALNRYPISMLQSPERYVSLQPSREHILGINDHFRLYADGLDIVSFYETIPAKARLIVGRDSAAMDLPDEMLVPLDADHDGISKFKTRHDENYITFPNILSRILRRLHTYKTRLFMNLRT